MHLDISNVRMENFSKAERNLEILKILFEFDSAAEVFTMSEDFYTSGINGMQL